MSCENDLTHELRTLGFRVTPQRRVILHILRHANDHLTPSEVFALAQEILPGLTEPTVYRTLEFLAQTGLAQAAFGSSGKRAYEISDHYHHHLICRQCGMEVEIPHTQLEKLYAALEVSTNYKLAHNHITFVGLCPACQ